MRAGRAQCDTAAIGRAECRLCSVIPCVAPRVRGRAHATARRPQRDWPIRASGPTWEAARCQVLESDAARLRILRQLWAEQAKRCAPRCNGLGAVATRRARRPESAVRISVRILFVGLAEAAVLAAACVRGVSGLRLRARGARCSAACGCNIATWCAQVLVARVHARGRHGPAGHAARDNGQAWHGAGPPKPAAVWPPCCSGRHFATCCAVATYVR